MENNIDKILKGIEENKSVSQNIVNRIELIEASILKLEHDKQQPNKEVQESVLKQSIAQKECIQNITNLSRLLDSLSGFLYKY